MHSVLVSGSGLASRHRCRASYIEDMRFVHCFSLLLIDVKSCMPATLSASTMNVINGLWYVSFEKPGTFYVMRFKLTLGGLQCGRQCQ